MAASIILSPFSIPITHRSSHRTTGYYLSATVAGNPHLNCSHKPISPSFHNLRRRQILLSCTFPAMLLNPVFFPNSAAAETENTRGNELIQKLLEKSKANKAKYDKERLDDYYKRNYKEYFEFVEGSIQNKKGDMSEAEKGIIEWLRKNR